MSSDHFYIVGDYSSQELKSSSFDGVTFTVWKQKTVILKLEFMIVSWFCSANMQFW